MNFSAVVVVLALAVSMSECSVLPWSWASQIAGNGLAYTAVSGPTVLAAPVGPAAISLATHAAAPAAVVVAAQAAAPSVVVAAPALEGTYVAQTRGAVHTAPLSGHIQSVANVNVAPAPGTL